jgi:hypothetical protein
MHADMQRYVAILQMDSFVFRLVHAAVRDRQGVGPFVMLPGHHAVLDRDSWAAVTGDHYTARKKAHDANLDCC